MACPDVADDLARLLADPPRAPDTGFTNMVAMMVRADTAYAEQRRRAWRRAMTELLSIGAVLCAAGLALVLPDASAAGARALPLAGAGGVALVVMLWLGTHRWRVLG